MATTSRENPGKDDAREEQLQTHRPLEKPKVGKHADMVPSQQPNASNIVHNRATDKYLRMGNREFEFLRSLDGEHCLNELCELYAGTFSQEQVVGLVHKLAELKLLEGSVPIGEDGRSRWIRARDRSVIQFSLLNPDSVLDKTPSLINVTIGPIGRIVSLLVLLTGVLSLVFSFEAIVQALNEPMEPWTPLLLLASIFLVGVFHELAHAATVKYYGGSVSRMGMVLFYLFPALFCDTSDSWKFQNRWHRVIVSFAGIYLQIIFCALAVIAFWMFGYLNASSGTSTVQNVLALFLVLNGSLCLFNFIPFVKLDGYWMLSNAINVPNLRSKSNTYVVSLVKRMFFGRDAPVRHPKWPIACALFGTLSLSIAPVLVISALLYYQEMLLSFGWLGALIWLAIAAGILSWILLRLLRILREGISYSRVAVLRVSFGAIAASLLVALLSQSQLPVKVHATYEMTDQGTAEKPVQVRAYVSHGDAALVNAGSGIALLDKSLLGSSTVGEATISTSYPEVGKVSPIAAIPMKEPPNLSEVQRPSFPVNLAERSDNQDLDLSGPAVIRTDPKPLPAWFYSTYLRPVHLELKDLTKGVTNAF